MFIKLKICSHREWLMYVSTCGDCLLLGNVTWYLVWLVELWCGIPPGFSGGLNQEEWILNLVNANVMIDLLSSVDQLQLLQKRTVLIDISLVKCESMAHCGKPRRSEPTPIVQCEEFSIPQRRKMHREMFSGEVCLIFLRA